MRRLAWRRGGLSFRRSAGPQSGWNGVAPCKPSAPAEVGVLGIITASDPETSSEIAKLINPYVLHYPLTRDEELPTFAFPFRPRIPTGGRFTNFALTM